MFQVFLLYIGTYGICGNNCLRRKRPGRENGNHKFLKAMGKRKIFGLAGDRTTSRSICRTVSMTSLSVIRSKLSSLEHVNSGVGGQNFGCLNNQTLKGPICSGRFEAHFFFHYR